MMILPISGSMLSFLLRSHMVHNRTNKSVFFFWRRFRRRFNKYNASTLVLSISSSNDHWSDWLSLSARPKSYVCERRYHGTIFPSRSKSSRVKIALLQLLYILYLFTQRSDHIFFFYNLSFNFIARELRLYMHYILQYLSSNRFSLICDIIFFFFVKPKTFVTIFVKKIGLFKKFQKLKQKSKFRDNNVLDKGLNNAIEKTALCLQNLRTNYLSKKINFLKKKI